MLLICCTHVSNNWHEPSNFKWKVNHEWNMMYKNLLHFKGIVPWLDWNLKNMTTSWPHSLLIPQRPLRKSHQNGYFYSHFPTKFVSHTAVLLLWRREQREYCTGDSGIRIQVTISMSVTPIFTVLTIRPHGMNVANVLKASAMIWNWDFKWLFGGIIQTLPKVELRRQEL